MTLTPDDFKADLKESDFRKLRREVRAEQVRQTRAIEFTVADVADPKLTPGEVVWLEVPQEGIDGRFMVISSEPTANGTQYTLIGQDHARKRPGDKVIKIERLG
jgi:hypothetical protein